MIIAIISGSWLGLGSMRIGLSDVFITIAVVDHGW